MRRPGSPSWRAGRTSRSRTWQADSWTAPVDVRRIHPDEDTVGVTAGQVADLVNRLRAGAGAQPLFVFDAGYDPVALTEGLANVNAQILVRIRDDRVFYADLLPRIAGTNGRPRSSRRRHPTQTLRTRPRQAQRQPKRPSHPAIKKTRIRESSTG